MTSWDEVQNIMARDGVAALSVATIEDGEISFARTWGVRDTSSAEPVGAETVFQAGSISKPVAVIAALLLAERGVIDLDRDIAEYLNSWAVPVVHGWRPRISSRMLITHLAGLTVHGFPGYPPSAQVPVLREVLNGLGNTLAVQPDGLPGLFWRYSGGGTTVLQQLLVDVTGEAFPGLMRQLVLDPLGMTRSTYDQPLPQPFSSDAASAHVGMLPSPERWDVFPEMAAAGLWSTPSDLARLCVAVADSYLGRANALLERSTALAMLHGQPRAEGMGLGFMLSTRVPLVFGHNGSQAAGFNCRMACTADGIIGTVAMTNSAEGMAVAEEVVRFVGMSRGVDLAIPLPGQSDSDSVARDSTASRRAAPRRVRPRPGRFAVGDIGITVAVTGRELRATLDGQAPLGFFEDSGWWRTGALDTALRFEGDTLIVRQYGREIMAAAVPPRDEKAAPA